MNTIVRLLVTGVGVVVLAGCGGNAPDGSGPPAGSGPASARSAPSAHSVVSVSFHRSGGLKPVHVSRVFAAGEAPPPGFSPSDQAKVLRAAQQLIAASPKIKPLPSHTCCDRYVYTVSIELSDGTTRTYASVDGVDQPKAFDDLLSRLA